MRRLDEEDQIGLKSLLRFYSLAVLAEDPLIWVQFPDDCTASSSSRLSRSTLGALVTSTFFFLGNPAASSTAVLDDFLTRMRFTRGITESELIALYILKHYGPAFRTDSAEVLAVILKDYKRPDELLLSKTTPSAEANNQMAAKLSEVVPWEQLGMNTYTSLGDNPAYLIAEARYSYPLATAAFDSLFPVLGSAFEAFDAFESLREGRNAAGQNQNRLFSAGLLTLNTAAAMLDLPAANGLIAGTAKTARLLAKQARRAESVDEVVLGLQALSRALKGATATGGQAVGQQVLKAWAPLGRPVKVGYSMVSRALKYTIDGDGVFIKYMFKGIKGVTKEIIDLRRSGKLPTDDAGIRALFDKCLQKIANANWLANRYDKYATLFGVPRKGGVSIDFSTVITERYEIFKEMLIRYAKKGSRFDQKGTISGVATSVESGWSNQMVGTLPDGTSIHFGRITTFDNPVQLAGGFTFDTIVVHWSRMWSPPVDGSVIPDIEKVLAHASTLFGRAIDPKKAASRAEVIDLAAEMYWWIINVVPYERGSASIADALHKSVLRYRGIRVGMWKKNVSPDFWAFTHSLDEFKQVYPTLFDDLSDVPALDMTLSAAARGVPGIANYPVRPVVPLMEGHAKLDFTGPTRALSGYVASRVLTYLQPARQGNTKIQGVTNNVRVLFHYEDSRPDRTIVVEANQPSPAEIPDDLLDLANTDAGFKVPLTASESQDYDAGLLTMSVFAQDSVYGNEELLLGTFTKISGSKLP